MIEDLRSEYVERCGRCEETRFQFIQDANGAICLECRRCGRRHYYDLREIDD